MNFESCTFVFLRHGKTAPNTVDALRELTDLGREQAIEFKKKYGIDFDVVLSSSATRAIKTAEIIADEEVIPLEILYALPDEYENRKLMKMGERHGYASLYTYLEKEGDNGILLHKIGKEGVSEINYLLRSVVGIKVLIVAHAVTINSLIHWMFQESPVATEVALHTQLGECQAIQITTGKNGEVIDATVI